MKSGLKCLIIFIALKTVTAAQSDGSLCERQAQYIEDNSEKHLWARKMKDAWGKFPSGVYSGNRFDFGNFDQCINFAHSSNDLGHIRGQYCLIFFQHDLEQNMVHGHFAPKPFDTKVSIAVAHCLPHSCNNAEVVKLANSTLIATRNATVSDQYRPDLFCSKKHEGLEFDALQTFAITLFSLVVLLIASSSVYEVMQLRAGSKPNQMLKSFSLYTNAKALLSMTPMSDNEVVFYHGLRALSIIWVVYAHTYLVGFWQMPVLNANDFTDWFEDYSSMFILGGIIGVDTFFVLSAMLLTVSVFRELDKTRRINLPLLCIKRYLRITVPFAAMILFVLTFLYTLSHGPLWHFVTTMTSINFCQDYWWSALLYISNYSNPGRLCLGHSWFLIVDMQLYFLSPLILYPLWRFRKHVKSAVTAIFLIASVSIVYVFVIYVLMDFRVSIVSEMSGIKDFYVYYATHARLDSWMIGILTGFVLHQMEGKIVKFSRTSIAFGWSLCIGNMLLVIFAQYPLQQEYFLHNSIYFDATYDAFKRLFWCLSIMWIIIACKLNYGGVVKRFLSLPIWLPISKLSYCIYLMHLPIQAMYMSTVREPQYFTNYRALYKFFGDFGVSFFVALAWSLMFECPTLQIMKVWLDSRKKDARTRQTQP